jgi:AraC family transcriptional regulator
MKRGNNTLFSDEYRSRINRVIDHIDQALQTKLSLEGLSRVACFSKYHFHRIFHTITGETLFEYIQRRRIEKAAHLLRANPGTPITDIAHDCGFCDSAAFARSFRQRFGITASRWRSCSKSNLVMANSNQRQDIGSQARHNRPIAVRMRKLATRFKRVRVTVEKQPDLTVAYLRHVGPFQGDVALFAHLFRRLFTWAEARDLVRPWETRALIVVHDSPGITDERKLRVSVCITVPPHTTTDAAVGKMIIEGGKYARARFALRPQEYADAWTWMFGTWLPASGYQPDDRPCFEMYPVPAQHRGGRSVVEICVPVKPI